MFIVSCGIRESLTLLYSNLRNKIMANPVTYPGARLAGLQIDLLEKLRKGVLSEDQLELFLRKKNPFENLFDEAAYFKDRPGLCVDPDLERFVGFTIKPARGLVSLTSYTLERDTTEADIFGTSGSAKRAEVIAGVVDLSQIAALIDLQSGGAQGKLLSDGRANFFAVIGKNGVPFVVGVSWFADNREWCVLCLPWREQDVWNEGRRVFSNLL